MMALIVCRHVETREARQRETKLEPACLPWPLRASASLRWYWLRLIREPSAICGISLQPGHQVHCQRRLREVNHYFGASIMAGEKNEVSGVNGSGAVSIPHVSPQAAPELQSTSTSATPVTYMPSSLAFLAAQKATEYVTRQAQAARSMHSDITGVALAEKEEERTDELTPVDADQLSTEEEIEAAGKEANNDDRLTFEENEATGSKDSREMSLSPGAVAAGRSVPAGASDDVITEELGEDLATLFRIPDTAGIAPAPVPVLGGTPPVAQVGGAPGATPPNGPQTEASQGDRLQRYEQMMLDRTAGVEMRSLQFQYKVAVQKMVSSMVMALVEIMKNGADNIKHAAR